MRDYSDLDFNALEAKYARRNVSLAERGEILTGMYSRLAKAHRSRGNEAAAQNAEKAARKAAAIADNR